jgi:hypothetical protein
MKPRLVFGMSHHTRRGRGKIVRKMEEEDEKEEDEQ